MLTSSRRRKGLVPCLAAMLIGGLGCNDALAAAPSPKAAITPGEHRWAVLISASAYESLSHFPSRNENLTLLKECLVQAGVPQAHVFLMCETAKDSRLRPTHANIEAQLAWLRGQARRESLLPGQPDALEPADEVVLAIALYGVRRGDVQYLCPIDGRLPRADDRNAVGENLLPVETVREGLSACAAGRKLLLLNVFNEDPRPSARGRVDGSDLDRFDVARLRPTRGYGELIGYDTRQVEAKDVAGFLNLVVAGLQGQADYFGGNKDGLVSLWELAQHVQKRPGLNFKSVVVGDDFPLSPVQVEPPPPVRARYDVLIRLTGVLLHHRMNEPAVDSSTRAIHNAPGPEATAEGYARRADAHLGKADYAAALADSQRAEKPLTAVAARAGNVQVGEEIVGQVQPGQKVQIVKVEGDFLGITTTRGDSAVHGWMHKKACPLDPTSAGPKEQRAVPRGVLQRGDNDDADDDADDDAQADSTAQGETESMDDSDSDEDEE